MTPTTICMGQPGPVYSWCFGSEIYYQHIYVFFWVREPYKNHAFHGKYGRKCALIHLLRFAAKISICANLKQLCSLFHTLQVLWPIRRGHLIIACVLLPFSMSFILPVVSFLFLPARERRRSHIQPESSIISVPLRLYLPSVPPLRHT